MNLLLSHYGHSGGSILASIRKRKGSYQVQVRRKGFPDISRTFHRLQDAKEWARNIEVQADRNELPENRKSLEQISLGQLVVRYRDEVVVRKKGREIEEIILNAFLRDPICKTKLSDLATSHFATYRDKRLTEITAKSLKRQLSPLQNMFEIAQEEWGIPIKENPLTKLKLKVTDNKRERRLRDGELERLLEAGKRTENPYVIPVVLFALETGLRRGEILSLGWDQVDLKRSSVTILESKNGHSRTIPLTPKALELLHSCIQIGKRQIESNLVFPVSANALRMSWGRLCKRAGIRDLHFHDLRHEAISRFFEMGLTVPEVASISGHKDLRMLLRYAHSNNQSIRDKLNWQLVDLE